MSEASSEKTNLPFGMEFLEDLEMVPVGQGTQWRTLDSGTILLGDSGPAQCDR